VGGVCALAHLGAGLGFRIHGEVGSTYRDPGQHAATSVIPEYETVYYVSVGRLQQPARARLRR